MLKRVFLILLICYPLLAQTQKSGTENPDNSKEKNLKIWTVFFRNAEGIEVPLYCHVAITEEEKATGLMFRDHLPKNEGMIFVYSKPRILNFWMQHTKIPLTIAFIAKKNYIISLHQMKPFDKTVIHSDIPALYAVEANAGWFKKNRISIHDKVRIVKYKVIKEDKISEEKKIEKQ